MTKMYLSRSSLAAVTAVLFVAVTLAGWTVATVSAVRFEIGCGGHLKRAAYANTVATAQKELDSALEYARKNGLSAGGSTHIFWATPATDIGFWYDNLNDSAAELRNLSPEATPLEKTNVLMKLRETLLDGCMHGEFVTKPQLISLFPHTRSIFLSGFAFLGLFISFFISPFSDVLFG